jgi:Family of unknown function (DUF6804)
MLTTIMKYVAISALLLGIVWEIPVNPRGYLDFVIAAGAVFVLVQAVKLRKYFWVAAFVAVAGVFNPLRPMSFSSSILVALQIMSAALFAVSLHVLQAKPRMTIASITETNPQTEAL